MNDADDAPIRLTPLHLIVSGVAMSAALLSLAAVLGVCVRVFRFVGGV